MFSQLYQLSCSTVKSENVFELVISSNFKVQIKEPNDILLLISKALLVQYEISEVNVTTFSKLQLQSYILRLSQSEISRFVLSIFQNITIGIDKFVFQCTIFNVKNNTHINKKHFLIIFKHY